MGASVHTKLPHLNLNVKEIGATCQREINLIRHWRWRVIILFKEFLYMRVSNVYGSGREGVNRMAQRVFSGGTHFEADITKLMKVKPRYSPPKPRKKKTSDATQMKVASEKAVMLAPVPERPIDLFPPIEGGICDSARNLSLNLVAMLSGCLTSEVRENRTHYIPELGCFARLGAYSTWSSSTTAESPNWGCGKDDHWCVYAHCWYFEKAYCSGPHHSLCLKVFPELLINSRPLLFGAIFVKTYPSKGGCPCELKMPAGYKVIDGEIRPAEAKQRAIFRTKNQESRLRKICALVKELAYDVSVALSRSGSVVNWSVDKAKPIDAYQWGLASTKEGRA